MLFSADGEMATCKNLLLNFFFPSSPNDLKLLQYFLTCIGRFVGIFDLIHIYLGNVKSFQTLHVHNAGKYRYKIGTFKTKKFFSNLFITLNIVYICIFLIFK